MKNDVHAIDRPDGTTVYRSTWCGAKAEAARSGGILRELTPEEVAEREAPRRS
jgi:hypothetical protein